MRLRAFGTVDGDLDLDLGARNRAALITRLLELCTVDADDAPPTGVYENLTAGQRLERLLVLAAGGADKTITRAEKCGACGEWLEIELPLPELTALQREADAIAIVPVDANGRRIVLRKPTGRDLQAWAELEECDEATAIRRLVATLAIDGDAVMGLDDEALRAIERALDEADPLVNFTCQVRCGECGQVNDYAVDLTDTALGLLAAWRQELMATVHRLASRYHWSEREILAIPDWRRRLYLELAAGR